jgi:hypothetical protein
MNGRGLCVAALGWLAACNSGGSLSQSQAAAVCVVAQTCFPAEWASGFFGGTLAECASGGGILPPEPGSLTGSEAVITGLEGPLEDIYRCIAASDSCAEAGNCFGRDGTEGTCTPPGSLASGSCDGAALEGCSADGVAFDVDCEAYGESCHEDSIFFATSAVCDLGDCPTRTQCEGSEAQVCEGQGFWLADCGRLGLSCVVPPDGGGAECWGPGSCDGGTPTCDGNVVIACSEDVPVREDCSQNPTFQRCQAGACVETGNQCTVATNQASCDGTKVKLCQDGFFREVDCVPLGFSGCQGGACTK